MLIISGAGVRSRMDEPTGTLELLKPRTEVLELKDILVEDDTQPVLRMSWLLGNVTTDY